MEYRTPTPNQKKNKKNIKGTQTKTKSKGKGGGGGGGGREKKKKKRKKGPRLGPLGMRGGSGGCTMISLKFVLDPQHAAANAGIMIQPGLGFTNTRAGFGGFPLGFAAILVFCLFSSRRLLPALSSISTVAAVILAVRLYGAAEDASFSQSAHILIPEAVLLVVSLLGAVMETKRRRHDAATAR